MIEITSEPPVYPGCFNWTIFGAPIGSACGTPTPAGPPWGDVDCTRSVTIGDAQKIARWLIDLPVNQQPGCPGIGSEVASLFGDVDCSGVVTIGDAQKVARWLIGLPVNQAPGCLQLG